MSGSGESNIPEESSFGSKRSGLTIWLTTAALILAVACSAALAALFFNQYDLDRDVSQRFQEQRLEIDKLERSLKEAESAVNQLESWQKGLSVGDHNHLQALMTAQINRYVANQKKKAERARFKEFEAAPETAEGHLYGSESAKIALIEFSDYDCPFCTRFHPTPKKIVDASEGNVKWIYKHFPLDSIHPQARAQAIAAECVSELKGNRAFWAFSDRLMNTKNGVQYLTQFASEVGIDAQSLSDCINKGEKEKVVLADMEMAMKLGVTGTPATVIMNTETGKAVMLSGAVSEKAILDRIKTVL